MYLEVIQYFSHLPWVQEAKIDDPIVIADLAKVRMLELEHKQEELRSELIKLRNLYNITRKSYNAVRKVYL